MDAYIALSPPNTPATPGHVLDRNNTSFISYLSTPGRHLTSHRRSVAQALPPLGLLLCLASACRFQRHLPSLQAIPRLYIRVKSVSHPWLRYYQVGMTSIILLTYSYPC
jgi:hypothetical protein